MTEGKAIREICDSFQTEMLLISCSYIVMILHSFDIEKTEPRAIEMLSHALEYVRRRKYERD